MIFFRWPTHPPTKASGRILLLHCSRPPEIVIQSFRKKFENFDFCDESFSVEVGKDLKIRWVCTVSSLAIITSETPTAACTWKDDKGMKTETESCPEQILILHFWEMLQLERITSVPIQCFESGLESGHEKWKSAESSKNVLRSIAGRQGCPICILQAS